ncbi:MAG: four helix bundle protein [Sphingobacteriales bacterium]|nr:four helix bundle protein [Sphingobacteriales bacterium]
MLNLSHKDLLVYKMALKLVRDIYVLTNSFPKNEQYILVSQIRRAVISACSNIAEGAARKWGNDRKKYYSIARSSLVEVDTQLEAALVLDYIRTEDLKQIEPGLVAIFKMLSKMISNLESNQADGNVI